MDRLTEYICDAAHGKRGRTIEEASKSKDFCRGEFEATGCVDRLAAYEDTGMMPDEILHWIPCSEKLPTESDGTVLICMPNTSPFYCKEPFINAKHDQRVSTATYSEFSKEWCFGDMCGFSDTKPIAWMPFPQPPKDKP